MLDFRGDFFCDGECLDGRKPAPQRPDGVQYDEQWCQRQGEQGNPFVIDVYQNADERDDEQHAKGNERANQIRHWLGDVLWEEKQKQRDKRDKRR